MAVSAYSGRHSRMWTWDANSLEITGFQDIKARVNLLDVSPDGRYCSYFAEAHQRDECYVAVSRPPYFRALWLRKASHLSYRAAIFSGDRQILYNCMPTTRSNAVRPLVERTVEGCPFEFRRIGDPYKSQEWHGLAWPRCSGAIEGCGELKEIPWRAVNATKRKMIKEWVGKDPRGRAITVCGAGVCADGEPFLDCSRQQFVEVAPPAWASEW